MTWHYITRAGTPVTIDDPLDWLDRRLDDLNFSRDERDRLVAEERARQEAEARGEERER